MTEQCLVSVVFLSEVDSLYFRSWKINAGGQVTTTYTNKSVLSDLQCRLLEVSKQNNPWTQTHPLSSFLVDRDNSEKDYRWKERAGTR